eukprot:CAMPEP_0182445852 /NCGR_PEP_ID=MMETSP1172-20130603/3824_1 /TAXON_ID=708627 /ORGANISM="Timspurckia oligopyrenoides, Strain CCMP3278" /LENGTH=249 /DNA_ID=CAMNT_0024641681 /DNA_START=303 /DNA_END=1052 /DNA_ORIENTATION=-
MASSSCGLPSTLVFRQLFEADSCTYTYLLADSSDSEGECILIDPVDLTIDRDAKIISELNLTPTLLLNTHVHADHITGTGLLKQKCFPNAKSVLSKVSGGRADRYVEHGERLGFGGFEMEVRSTPGHTNGCVTYVLFERGDTEAPVMAFTGDALLIRGCGRTDFQQGDSRRLYQSVHSQIFTLPDSTLLYPAHDYKGQTVTTCWEEKKFNPRLTKSEEEFVTIMQNLNLPYPRKIDESLPLNLVCGINE